MESLTRVRTLTRHVSHGQSAAETQEGRERSAVAPVFPGWVVFTDLDGTLLDADTYRYDAAQPALQRLRELAIPLIICTSKTRAEVEPLRAELGNKDPFIVENGGALYIPEGYFHSPMSGAGKRHGYRVIEMGVRYPWLRKGLRRIEQEAGVSLTGFGDMTIERVAEATGLARPEAERAREREYDEPFLAVDDRLFQSVCEAARRLGLTVIRGGQFFHLVGGIDKGRACRSLIDCYRREWQAVSSAGIGDNFNDVPMLESVDRSFLVERPGGGHADCDVAGLTRVQGVGPAGWAAAIEQLLQANAVPTERVTFRPSTPSVC